MRLDLETLQVVVFADSSFANNEDLSSRIGFIIVLADANHNANVLHSSSIKCKRVTMEDPGVGALRPCTPKLLHKALETRNAQIRNLCYFEFKITLHYHLILRPKAVRL